MVDGKKTHILGTYVELKSAQLLAFVDVSVKADGVAVDGFKWTVVLAVVSATCLAVLGNSLSGIRSA